MQKLIGVGPAASVQRRICRGYRRLVSTLCRTQAGRHLSKLATSRYQSGRSNTRLKTKCFTESDFILLGIDRGRKTRAPRAVLARTERVDGFRVGDTINFRKPAQFEIPEGATAAIPGRR